MSSAGEMPQPGAKGRWMYRLVMACSAAVPVVLRATDVLSEPAVIRVGAIAWLLVGLGLLGRTDVHVRGKYFRWQTGRRILAALVAADAIVGLGLIAAGLVSLLAHSHPSWLVAPALAALVAVYVIGSAKFEHSAAAKLDTGTDLLRTFGEVRWIRREAKKWGTFPGVAIAFRALFEAKAPPGELSYFMRAVIVLLVFATIATGVPAAAGAGRFLAETTDDLPVPPRPIATVQVAEDDPGTGTQKPTRHGTSRRKRTPTYEDNCGKRVSPGDGAGALGPELYKAWIGLGEPAVGCAIPAQQVVGHLGVYAALGFCRSDFRSIGVISPQHTAAVLIDQPALLARALFGRGELIGASKREPLGQGDFQLVFAGYGAWVEVRRQTTDGKGGLKRRPRRCTDVKAGGGTYVELPPALADLWLELAEVRGLRTWPSRDLSRDRPGIFGYSFFAEGDAQTVVASGECSTEAPFQCTLKAPGFERLEDSRTTAPVDVDRVRRFGPTR